MLLVLLETERLTNLQGPPQNLVELFSFYEIQIELSEIFCSRIWGICGWLVLCGEFSKSELAPFK